MKLSGLKIFASFFLAAILSAPAWATNTGANSALPGTLNYVEGQADIGQQALNAKSIGSTELQPGQVLDTGNGKAEILLTPGVFLRAGSDSSIRMLNLSLTDTEVSVDKGHAMVEVDQIYPQNYIRVAEDGSTTRLLKRGLYAFDAADNEVRVFDGKAVVQDGDQHTTVKGGHEVALNTTGKLKAKGFDKKQYEADDLYRWSSLRSSYLAEANVDTARLYVADGWYGPGWFGAGWYWNPWFASYTFIPGAGVLYSPFGWGFYSPLWAYRAPVLYGHGFYHSFNGYHAPYYARGRAFSPRVPAGEGFRTGPAIGHAMGGFGGFHGFSGGARR